MSERMVLIHDVPLSDADVALLIATGFAYRADDGILTLTEKGSAWLSEWCKKRIALWEQASHAPVPPDSESHA